MGYIQAIVGFYLVFSGRTGRATFWISTLILIALSAVVCLFMALAAKAIVFIANGAPIAFDFRPMFFILGVFRFLLLFFVAILPLSALITRRLHDAGFSGLWFAAFAAAAIVAHLLSFHHAVVIIAVALAVILLMPSSKNAERYGELRNY